MKAVGSQATREVVETWAAFHGRLQQFTGERRERLQQIAERLRAYNAMQKAGDKQRRAVRADTVCLEASKKGGKK